MDQAHVSQEVQRCIELCLGCYRECRQHAMNHCLETGGRHVEPKHFRLMISCADICRTAADFMLNGSPGHGRVCGVCAEVCEACAKSCEGLSGMESCIGACRSCAE